MQRGRAERTGRAVAALLTGTTAAIQCAYSVHRIDHPADRSRRRHHLTVTKTPPDTGATRCGSASSRAANPMAQPKPA
jgi:hypothetical protein